MAAYKVEICGVNTSTLPILKEEEKAELFQKIRQGDLAAQRNLHQGESASGSECNPAVRFQQ